MLLVRPGLIHAQRLLDALVQCLLVQAAVLIEDLAKGFLGLGLLRLDLQCLCFLRLAFLLCLLCEKPLVYPVGKGLHSLVRLLRCLRKLLLDPEPEDRAVNGLLRKRKGVVVYAGQRQHVGASAPHRLTACIGDLHPVLCHHIAEISRDLHCHRLIRDSPISHIGIEKITVPQCLLIDTEVLMVLL